MAPFYLHCLWDLLLTAHCCARCCCCPSQVLLNCWPVQRDNSARYRCPHTRLVRVAACIHQVPRTAHAVPLQVCTANLWAAAPASTPSGNQAPCATQPPGQHAQEHLPIAPPHRLLPRRALTRRTSTTPIGELLLLLMMMLEWFTGLCAVCCGKKGGCAQNSARAQQSTATQCKLLALDEANSVAAVTLLPNDSLACIHLEVLIRWVAVKCAACALCAC